MKIGFFPLKCEFTIFKSKTYIICCKPCMIFSNDIKTMADSPVQGEFFRLAHKDFKKHQRETETLKIINASLKKILERSICLASMQTKIFNNKV